MSSAELPRTQPCAVDSQAVVVCADALLAPYDAAVVRAQAALSEIRCAAEQSTSVQQSVPVPLLARR
jgi:hypothetical protein